ELRQVLVIPSELSIAVALIGRIDCGCLSSQSEDVTHEVMPITVGLNVDHTSCRAIDIGRERRANGIGRKAIGGWTAVAAEVAEHGDIDRVTPECIALETV